MKPIGYVVGESEADRFLFVTDPLRSPPRLEYVMLEGIKEKIGASVSQVDLLAQVIKLQAASEIFDQSLTFPETETILKAEYAVTPKILATAQVLGFLDSAGNIFLPRSAPLPGHPVQIAPDELLERFFTHNIPEGIEVGSLLNRPQVKVKADPNGLRRHLAIIAQTGAGKSYLTGLLLENLLQMGGNIIVFDPNSDYVCLRKAKTGGPTTFAQHVTVFRVPNIKGRRFSDEQIGGSEPYTIQFSKLDVEEICALSGISKAASNIRQAIKIASQELDRANVDYRPLELLSKIKELAGETTIDPYMEAQTRRFIEEEEEPISLAFSEKKRKSFSEDIQKGAERAIKYLENLQSFDVWGFRDVPIDKLLEPMRLSVIDLAGIERAVSEFVVDKTLREIWARATTGRLPYPVFIVLEEAHTFVPQKSEFSACADIINRIASEGRKFKVFLIAITQRPHKIHQDTLSQCSSQIIMKLTNPEDQDAVKRAAENISASLFADLPGLNVGEAILLGTLTRVPVMVRVGNRASEEGGSDIDLREALAQARREKLFDPFREEKIERKEPREAI